MNTKAIGILVIILFSGFSSLFAQGFIPPTEGKSVVYFVRLSAFGGADAFEYFHQDRYIGAFKGSNYLRYECEPGEQLFWASSENKEFLTSDLQAGGSYIVIVDIIMGFWKAHVGFTPISMNDTEKFERAKKLILDKKPSITPPEKIEKTNKKLEKFIPEMLKLYEEQWMSEKNFRHISADMAIHIESM